MPFQEKLPPSSLPDKLIGEGRYWFTIDEATELLDRPKKNIYPRLAELEKRHRLFSPTNGLYVVVPAEYREWGVVPAEWYIDPMMRHLNRSYYVSFLSAAARHGASHQAPQAFQVIVDNQLEDRSLGRVRLHFIRSTSIEQAELEQMTSPTGSYSVSSREMTAVDLAWRPREAGGISNVATVLKDIGELNGERLAKLAASKARGTSRRLGWLIELVRPDVDTFWLSQIARPQEGSPAVLVPGNMPRGSVDRAWGLRLNGSVEPD